MDRIRLLQISDIHWRKQLEMADDYSDIREGMLEDLKEYMKVEDLPFNKILICGDIAFSGKKAEYKRASNFLNELCKITKCPNNEIYLVPGNHDKDLNIGFLNTRNTLIEGLTKEYEDSKHTNDSNWIKILESEYPTVKMIYEPFKEYCEFASSYSSVEPIIANALDANHKHYIEPEDQFFWVSDGDFLDNYNVLIYGVNTALLSNLDDYDPGVRDYGHKLLLPCLAYRAAKLTTNHTINILMAHHPVKFLITGDNIKNELDKRYKVQFYGHVHIDDSDNTNDAVHIYSGALSPGDIEDKKYEPIYNIVDLSIKEINDVDNLHVNLMVRHWNGENFVKKDNKEFNLPINNHNSWNSNMSKQTQSLPVGISKRDIRQAFKSSPRQNEIVKAMYPKAFKDPMVTYTRNQLFLEQVRLDDKWNELWNLINK